MKTAVSVPDATFRRADRAAEVLGVSRSELYARALDEYLDRLENTNLTNRIDAALARSGGDPELTRAVVETSHAALADGEEW